MIEIDRAKFLSRSEVCEKTQLSRNSVLKLPVARVTFRNRYYWRETAIDDYLKGLLKTESLPAAVVTK